MALRRHLDLQAATRMRRQKSIVMNLQLLLGN